MGQQLKAQRAFNASQERISQMNNEFNAREAAINRAWQSMERGIQNDWNLAQWNRENEYNTPSAQRQRWEEAGYNPFFMPGDAGNASSMQSAGVGSPPPASSAGLPHQVPETPWADTLNLIDALGKTYSNAKTTYDLGMDMAYGADYRKAQIAGAIDGQYEMLTPQYRRMRENLSPDMANVDTGTKRQRYEGLKLENQYSAAKGIYTRLQADAQNTINKYLDKDQQLNLMQHVAQIFSDFTEGHANLAEVKRDISEYILNLETADGRRLNNRIARETADAFIAATTAEYEANANYYNTFKTRASQVAVNDVRNSNVERDMKSLDYKMNEIFYNRTAGESWRNNSTYRNIMGFWNDAGLGQLASLAAAAGVSRIPIKGITKTAAKKSPFKYKSDFNFHDYYKSKHYWDDYND